AALQLVVLPPAVLRPVELARRPAPHSAEPPRSVVLRPARTSCQRLPRQRRQSVRPVALSAQGDVTLPPQASAPRDRNVDRPFECALLNSLNNDEVNPGTFRRNHVCYVCKSHRTPNLLLWEVGFFADR